MISRADKNKNHRKRKGRISYKRLLVIGLIILASIAVYIWLQPFGDNHSGDSNLANPPVDQNSPDEKSAPDDQSASNNTDSTPQGDTDSKKPSEDTGVIDQSEGKQTVTLSFVGDIMMAGNVDILLKEVGYDYPYIHVKEYLNRADVAVANLETPITEQGEPEDKAYAYRSSPKALPDLVDSGIDIVNLANNHILDYGLIGMLDTINYLDEAGIQHVGAGNNEAEAYAPVIVEKNGLKIAFFGFSQVVPQVWWKAEKDHPGTAETYSYVRPVEAIKKVRGEVDLVIIIPHWGIERDNMPSEEQMNMGHRYIDAGADLVIGGHPHVLQSIEHYKDKWIAYSLGNFIFTTNDTPETWETVILEATCSKLGECNVQLVPILSKWAQPKPMDDEAGAALFNRIDEFFIDAAVDQRGNVTKTD